MSIMFPPDSVFHDNSGNILAAGTVTFYATGTTTLQAVYTDAALSLQADNPQTLTAAGKFTVPLYGSGSYTILIKDSNGGTIDTVDDVEIQNIYHNGTVVVTPTGDGIDVTAATAGGSALIDIITTGTDSSLLGLRGSVNGGVRIWWNDATSTFRVDTTDIGGGAVIDQVLQAVLNGATTIYHNGAPAVTTAANGSTIAGIINPNLIKVKTANTARSSTITIADDDHLAAYSLAATTYYRLEAFLKVSSTSVTPDIDFALQTSSAFTTSAWVVNSYDNGSLANGTANATTVETRIEIPNGARHIHLSGFVVTNGAATVDFQWAQNVSDAAAVTLEQGSWLRFEEIG